MRYYAECPHIKEEEEQSKMMMGVKKERKHEKKLKLVRLYAILMSMLFHHYKQLIECVKQVEQIEVKVERLLLLEKEKERKEDHHQHYHQLKIVL
jgi:hypothetical protein